MIALRKTLRVVDLFCGAGGATEAARLAAEDLGFCLTVDAINHNLRAVESHRANHPNVRHWCEDVSAISPRVAVPDLKVDLLLAGPSCTEHSYAGGAKVINDQQRMCAWQVLRWMEELDIANVVIENVPAFLNWGPIYPLDHSDPKKRGRPVPHLKGKFFNNFIRNIRCLGYSVDWKIVCAADHGDVQSRQRVFILCRKGRRRIPWADPTHAEKPEADMLRSALLPWRGAREILDLSNVGESVFTREQRGLKPLVPNTFRRIAAGMLKFNGIDLSPFVVQQNGTTPTHLTSSVHSVDRPLPTITGGNHLYLAQPFVIGQQSGSVARGVDDPLPTVATVGAISLCQPFLLPVEGFYRGNAPRPLNAPMPTITAERGAGHVVHPFLMHLTHQGSDRVHSVNQPLPTITGANRGEMAMLTPFLTKYYGTGTAVSVDEPLDTVTGKDRFGLCLPKIIVDGKECYLDIFYRLLTPRECARGQGFSDSYQFLGTKTEAMKQIGNAWPVNTGRALIRTLLKESHNSTLK